MQTYTLATIDQAVSCLKEGGVIAYPTEAVYGFGCDPFNVDAVGRLLQIKNRSIKKGFILIASHWDQVQFLLQPIDPKALAQVFASWPGPYTWVFPATNDVPFWLRGDHTTLAVRITAHPVAKNLCDAYGGALISTSANQDGQPPIRDSRMLQMTFANDIDLIVEGALGDATRPTMIRDAITGEHLRE